MGAQEDPFAAILQREEDRKRGAVPLQVIQIRGRSGHHAR